MLPRSTEIQPSVAPIRNTFGSVVGGVCRHRPPLQKIFSQVITGGGVLVCAPLGCVILTSVLMGGWISGMLCLGCVSIPQVGLGNRAQIKFEKKTNTFIWKLPIFRIFSTFGKSKCGFQIGSHEGEPRLELECARRARCEKSEIGGFGRFSPSSYRCLEFRQIAYIGGYEFCFGRVSITTELGTRFRGPT